MRPFMFIAAGVLALVTYVDAQRNRAGSASTDAGTRDEILCISGDLFTTPSGLGRRQFLQ